jgi:hypothetical protein
MEKLKDNWPAALVISMLIAAFVLTAIFAPPETQRWLFGAEGLLAVIIGLFQRSPSDRARVRKARDSEPARRRGEDRDTPAGPITVLLLAVAVGTALPACTPAQKAAFEGAVLSALELGAKAAGRELLSALERELKFGETSGGESP